MVKHVAVLLSVLECSKLQTPVNTRLWRGAQGPTSIHAAGASESAAGRAVKVRGWPVDAGCCLSSLVLSAAGITELGAKAGKEAGLGGSLWLLQSEKKKNPKCRINR